MIVSNQYLNWSLNISIVSIPILFVFSIFLLEVVLLYLSIIFIYLSFKNKTFLKYTNNLYTKIFLLFYFYILLRYFLRTEVYEHNNIIFYFRYWLYVISLFFLFNEFRKTKFYFLNGTFFILVILSVDSFIQFIFGKNLLMMVPKETHRITSFFGEESILGSFILRILPFTILYYFLLKSYKKNIYLIGVIYLFGLIAIFLSGEKASILLSFLMTFCFFILLKSLISKKMLVTGLMSFLIFTTLVITLNKDIRYRLFQETYDDIFNFKKGVNREFEVFNLRKKNFTDNYYIFSGYHNTLILTSLEMYKSNKIFGVGPRAYRHLCDDPRFNINKFSCTSHPHNFYIQVLGELGLVGLIFISLIYIYFCFKFMFILFIQNKSKKEYILGSIYIFFIVNYWPFIPTGNFYNNWLTLLIFLPFSFLLFENNKD